MKQIMRYCRCYVHSIGKIVCRIYQSKVRVWMDILKIINRRYTQLCLISRVAVPRRNEYIFFLQRAYCYQLIKKNCDNNNQSFNILLKSALLLRDKEKCILGHVISDVSLA